MDTLLLDNDGARSIPGSSSRVLKSVAGIDPGAKPAGK